MTAATTPAEPLSLVEQQRRASECRVCAETLIEPTGDQHHQERAPEPGLCLGCWTFRIELQKFVIRKKPERNLFTLRAEQLIRELLESL